MQRALACGRPYAMMRPVAAAASAGVRVAHPLMEAHVASSVASGSSRQAMRRVLSREQWHGLKASLLSA